MPITGSDLAVAGAAAKSADERRRRELLKTAALQSAVLNSASFAGIATDDRGSIQIFNVGARLILGYSEEDVLNQVTLVDISDPQEIVRRAHALSAESGAMIEPQASKSGIHVTFVGPDTPLFVVADRTRVKQVVVKLLSNAIKYNRAHGSVEVTCESIAGERVRASVRDTGEGLSQDERAQLFQAFNRLGQETGVEEGPGIGLVVSKRLVELMGSAIGAQSSVGVGSVFWIELNGVDAIESAAAVNPLPAVASSQLATSAPMRTVLCVEDNPANLLLISRLLARRSEIRLLSARDGRSGVELARSAQPEVILMDINLPGISGFMALQMLAADEVTAHIPVVALSANAMPRDIEKGLAAGFFRYLTKPIELNEFLRTLDLALEFARTHPGRAGQKEAS